MCMHLGRDMSVLLRIKIRITREQVNIFPNGFHRAPLPSLLLFLVQNYLESIFERIWPRYPILSKSVFVLTINHSADRIRCR